MSQRSLPLLASPFSPGASCVVPREAEQTLSAHSRRQAERQRELNQQALSLREQWRLQRRSAAISPSPICSGAACSAGWCSPASS